MKTNIKDQKFIYNIMRNSDPMKQAVGKDLNITSYIMTYDEQTDEYKTIIVTADGTGYGTNSPVVYRDMTDILNIFGDGYITEGKLNVAVRNKKGKEGYFNTLELL